MCFTILHSNKKMLTMISETSVNQSNKKSPPEQRLTFVWNSTWCVVTTATKTWAADSTEQSNLIHCLFAPQILTSDTNNCDVNFGVCSNAIGNFSCGCVEGFSLDYDFLACIGKFNYFFKRPEMDRELRVYLVRHCIRPRFFCIAPLHTASIVILPSLV